MTKKKGCCGGSCGSKVDSEPLDPNVQAIVEKHISRAKTGMEKYGVDTTRGDLSYQEWLVHHQEELMDAAIYVQRAMKNAELFERMRASLQALVNDYYEEIPTANILDAREVLEEAESLTPHKEETK